MRVKSPFLPNFSINSSFLLKTSLNFSSPPAFSKSIVLTAKYHAFPFNRCVDVSSPFLRIKIMSFQASHPASTLYFDYGEIR